MTVAPSVVETSQFFTTDPQANQRTLSTIALNMQGSEILKIAGQVRAMQAAGEEVCNLTVGDFSPQQFAIPVTLRNAIIAALNAGNTNYPPSDGMPELRKAVVDLYERAFGLRYPVDCVAIMSGSRPALYATYATLINPGEMIVYPVPSWNNNHYAHLTGARAVEIATRPEDGFLPTAAMIEPYIREARLIALNTPLNPTGTAIGAAELTRICELIVAENKRRDATGERSLYLLYDQVYWMLTFGDTQHVVPPAVVPEMAAYTIFVDGISKGFAATGVRVGWSISPPHIASRMRNLLGHVGAWAPKAEQLGTATLLNDPEAIAAYHHTMLPAVQARLDALYSGIMAMQDAGLPVDAIPPQGAIYLSARFDLIGKTINGVTFNTNDDIRLFVLQHAGFAVVPFGAFGLKGENGWMRLSVGAVSLTQVEKGLPRLRAALEA